MRAADLKYLRGRRKTAFRLPKLFSLDDTSADGVAVTSYGQGQVSATTLTVPAHGEIEVDFELDMLCVPPADMDGLSALIRSLLDAPRQHVYDDLGRTDVSGGASLFGFFSLGVAASYSDTKSTMDGWCLSEASQRTIIDSMMALGQQTNHFQFKGTVYNQDSEQDASGNIFTVVMGATVQRSSSHNQVRFVAPNVHLQNADGTTTLPCVGRLW